MNQRPSIKRIGFAALLLLLAALSVGFGGRIAWSDAMTLKARWLVADWRDGNGPAITPELWREVRSDLQEALANVPSNAALHDDLGFLYASRASSLGTPEPGSLVYNYRLELLDQAIGHYRASTELRPTYPFAWGYLALAKQLRQQVDDELWIAFDKALYYGHNEAGVQPTLAQIAFTHWNTLGQDRQQKIKQMVNTAQQQVKVQLLAQAAQYKVELR
jgi:hypothetical protein